MVRLRFSRGRPRGGQRFHSGAARGIHDMPSEHTAQLRFALWLAPCVRQASGKPQKVWAKSMHDGLSTLFLARDDRASR